MPATVHLVSCGPGASGLLTPDAAAAIASAELLIGASRLLATLPADDTRPRVALTKAADIARLLGERDVATAAVLFSGDTGFFSGATSLVPLLESCLVVLHPGVGSVAYLAAQLGIAWNALRLESAHGRDCNAVGALLEHPAVLFLTGGTHTPGSLCRQLDEAGLGDAEAVVGERLSYPDERLTRASARELADRDFDPLSVLLVRRGELPHPRLAFPGLDDSAFLRGDVPMTKREIRTAALSRLRPHGIVYDVGAGTGSVAVEAALLAPRATVYAIERETDALALIAQNRARFGAYNLTVVPGEAPAALDGLPPPDCVFVGGAGGQLEEIVTRCLAANPAARVVVTAVTLETAYEALSLLERLALPHLDAFQLAATPLRRAGRYHLFAAQNPIFVLSAGGDAP